MLGSALLTVAMVGAPVQTPKDETFSRKITKTVSAGFRVALPEGYDKIKRQKWPLMVFLHGSGERGNDLKAVSVHGPLKEIANGRKIPMIVVAPQCPADKWWDIDMLGGLVDHLERKYRVDKERIYITGLSMGGYGTWGLAEEFPNRFAAIAPVCGGGNFRLAKTIAHIPTWVTHGDADGAVPIAESQQMVDALIRAGAKPRFDIIKGGGHDVWTDFYAKDEFYTWLLAQKLPKV
jgi:predicted peptidase